MLIVPSILTNNPEEAKQMLLKCESVAHSTGSGLINRVSIDIIDGVFADNRTIDPSIMEDVETSLKIDYQLMTKEPINWVEKCIRGQADRIIGHVEMMSDQLEFVEKVTSVGLKVGLALDLDTPVEKIDRLILNDLDVVLVMSVKAGFGGQEFDTKVIEKIRKLDEIRSRDSTPFSIHDDGGVIFEYIDDLKHELVNEVSIGRKLFEGDLGENIKKFIEAAYK